MAPGLQAGTISICGVRLTKCPCVHLLAPVRVTQSDVSTSQHDVTSCGSTIRHLASLLQPSCLRMKLSIHHQRCSHQHLHSAGLFFAYGP